MRITSRVAGLVLGVGLWASSPAHAQYGPPGRIAPDSAPEKVLREFVAQVQTGTPDATFIGPQLWQLIATQTNNSGVYPALVQLGSIKKIEVIARRDLPAGPVYSMRVSHSSGESTWLLGVSTHSRKVEYASFSVKTGTVPSLPPEPDQGKAQSSEACRKFPNLCPS